MGRESREVRIKSEKKDTWDDNDRQGQYNRIMTDYGWLFRGDAAGEPIMTVEDGRSRRLLRRSTSRSRLEMAMRRYDYYPYRVTYLRAFCLLSAASRSARRLASCKLFSDVCC